MYSRRDVVHYRISMQCSLSKHRSRQRKVVPKKEGH